MASEGLHEGVQTISGPCQLMPVAPACTCWIANKSARLDVSVRAAARALPINPSMQMLGVPCSGRPQMMLLAQRVHPRPCWTGWPPAGALQPCPHGLGGG